MQLHRFERAAVAAFWDEPTGSWQYVLVDEASRRAAIIDPVWDYDPNAGATSLANAGRILDFVQVAGLKVDWVIDTHPHADHFSGAPWLAERLGASTAIGERVTRVQELWRDIYALGDLPADGSQWDRLLHEGDRIEVGGLALEVRVSPGHTLASYTLVTDGLAFVHDTLMMPDTGTSRVDFPGGSAEELWNSIQRILALPGGTALFVGHDYAPGGRRERCVATVDEHLADNIHVCRGQTREAFVALRRERDATLELPRQMLAALQVNIRGGRLPEPEPCGRRFMKIPLDRFPSPRG